MANKNPLASLANMQSAPGAKVEQKTDSKTLPITVLIESSQQLRIELKNIEELASSIAQHGLIQPITVVKKDKGFMVVDGHRRLEACKIAGLTSVPVYIKNSDDELKLAVHGFIANIQKDDLNAFEIALGLDRIWAIGNFANKSELALAIGKSLSWVSKNLELLNLPQEIKDDLALKLTPAERRKLGLEALYQIGLLADNSEEDALEAYNRIKNGDGRDSVIAEIKNRKQQKIFAVLPTALGDQETEINIMPDGTFAMSAILQDDGEIQKTNESLVSLESIGVILPQTKELPSEDELLNISPEKKEIQKIGKFWDMSKVLNGIDLELLAEHKTSFISEISNLFAKYSIMEVKNEAN